MKNNFLVVTLLFLAFNLSAQVGRGDLYFPNEASLQDFEQNVFIEGEHSESAILASDYSRWEFNGIEFVKVEDKHVNQFEVVGDSLCLSLTDGTSQCVIAISDSGTGGAGVGDVVTFRENSDNCTQSVLLNGVEQFTVQQEWYKDRTVNTYYVANEAFTQQQTVTTGEIGSTGNGVLTKYINDPYNSMILRVFHTRLGFIAQQMSNYVQKSVDGGRTWVALDDTQGFTELETGTFISGGGVTPTGRIIFFGNELLLGQSNTPFVIHSDDKGLTFSERRTYVRQIANGANPFTFNNDNRFTLGLCNELIFAQQTRSGVPSRDEIVLYDSRDNGLTWNIRSVALDFTAEGGSQGVHESTLRDFGRGVYGLLINQTGTYTSTVTGQVFTGLPMLLISQDYGVTWGGKALNEPLTFEDVASNNRLADFLPLQGLNTPLSDPTGGTDNDATTAWLERGEYLGNEWVLIFYYTRRTPQQGSFRITGFPLNEFLATGENALRNNLAQTLATGQNFGGVSLDGNPSALFEPNQNIVFTFDDAISSNQVTGARVSKSQRWTRDDLINRIYSRHANAQRIQ